MATNKKDLAIKVFKLTPQGQAFTSVSTFATETIKQGNAVGKTVKVITGQAFLPMPQNIEVNYAKDWGAEATMDTSSGVGAAAIAELQRVGYKATEIMTPDRMFAEGRFQKGVALNERKKLLFNSIDFRQFTIPLLFQPKTAGENATIQNWIKQVKSDSAPTLEGQTFFGFPNFFQLSWPKLDALFKTGPLALTNISVNYTPAGLWSEHVDGLPTATRVTLSFTEIDLATREKIDGENW